MGIQSLHHQRIALKKIAIIGPESTGKTWLAERLAAHFGEPFVPEYAREYLNEHGPDYIKEDLLKIAQGQIALEDERSEKASHFLFCDTNLVVLKIWSDFKFNETDPWIEGQLKTRKYDHYFLTDIDLPWEQDPQREHPHQREYLYGLYQNYLTEKGLEFSTISGHGEDRITSAIESILRIHG